MSVECTLFCVTCASKATLVLCMLPRSHESQMLFVLLLKGAGTLVGLLHHRSQCGTVASSKPAVVPRVSVPCGMSDLAREAHVACCRESAETIVLLEAILDGLNDERSGARRDLCANAAREFLVWTAKHIPTVKGKEGSHASSNLNAASLLRRLFERLMHPQTYQRSVSALAEL